MDRVLTTDGDLLVLTLRHRAERREADRLAVVVATLVERRERVARRRRRAVAQAIGRLCREVRRHHREQETRLWPSLEEWAPGSVDVSGLGNDHTALFACVERVDGLGRRSLQLGAGGTAPRHLQCLASGLRELAELLDEHLAEEERETFPLIADHLSSTRRRALGSALRTIGGSTTGLPRLLVEASPVEADALRADLGFLRAAMLPVALARHRRHHRTVVGAAR